MEWLAADNLRYLARAAAARSEGDTLLHCAAVGYSSDSKLISIIARYPHMLKRCNSRGHSPLRHLYERDARLPKDWEQHRRVTALLLSVGAYSASDENDAGFRLYLEHIGGKPQAPACSIL